MSCDNCHGNNGQVHIKIKIDGEDHEISWSESQAKNAGFHSVFDNQDFPLSDLIATVLKKNLPTKVDRKNNPQCPNCGLTFMELLEIGRIGCAQCYRAFGENMETLLDKIHGSIQHVGTVPNRIEKPVQAKKQTKARPKAKKTEPKLSKTDKLKLEMHKAIESEDYESAAKLRDKLKELEVVNK